MFQHDKSYLWQIHSRHNTQQWKTESLLAKSGLRQAHSLSQPLFKTVLEVLATAIGQGKERKCIQLEREEVKLPLYAGDMMLIL